MDAGELPTGTEVVMGYLTPDEYEAFGLSTDTADAWVSAASAMMEAHCRRTSLLSTSYTERVRVSERGQNALLSYRPVVSIDAVQAWYRRPRGEGSGACEGFALEYAVAFGLSGSSVTLNPSLLDVSLATGEVHFPLNVLDMRFSEADITYTAGLVALPNAVKVACAQIVKNAQATPGLNVRSSRVDTLQTQYFSDSLLDSQVTALLRPYVAERLG